MFVVRVRSVVSGKELKEGRREGGILRIFCAFDLFIPQHLIHPLSSWRGLFSFQFISFLFPFPFFFFFFKDETGTGAEDHLFQHTGTDGDMRTQRQAGVTRFIHQSCTHRGRGRELGGSVHIVFIHHHHRQSKQSKERRKIGGRRRRRRRRGEKPRT